MAEPRAAIDSNVLVYAIAGTGAKRAAAQDVVGRGGVVSVQALNEVAHVLRRKAGMDLPEIAEALATLRALTEIVPLTEIVHARALDVAASTGYSIWDAAILAAALEAGCNALISEDMQDGRQIDGLTIRNPFA